MKHMMLNELLAYADSSLTESGRRKIAAHVSTCEACRKRFVSLQTLKNSVRHVPPPLEDFILTTSCVPTEEMGDFLGKRLPDQLRETYISHVAACEMCFERAAYMSSETARMTEGVLSMTPTSEKYKNAVLPKHVTMPDVREKVSLLKTTKKWLSSPVPAYALAATLLFFVATNFSGGKVGGGISKLAHDENFSFYEEPAQSGPSFGFSDAGRKVGQSEAELDLEKTGDGVHFSWNKVKGAKRYSFSLSELTPTGPKEVLTTRVENAEITVEMSKFTPATAYLWVVRGSADEKTVFTAAGQFVNMP